MPAASRQRLVLASASPARLRLLREAGIEPEVVVSGIDETTEMTATPDIVATLAEAKAAAVLDRCSGTHVLGCDSMLELGGVAYGKPVDLEAAAGLWRRLSGAEADLYTGHCLIEAASGRRRVATARTHLWFARPSDIEIGAYLATGEPLGLAGAFSLDGRGAPFVEAIDGDPSNVIGLSLPLLRRMLGDFGILVTDLWERPA